MVIDPSAEKVDWFRIYLGDHLVYSRLFVPCGFDELENLSSIVNRITLFHFGCGFGLPNLCASFESTSFAVQLSRFGFCFRQG